MFAMIRRSALGLLVASAIVMVLCAVFLAASFVGVSLPRAAWAQGWLPVQVETEVPGTPRRKITRFPSLERAVAKAGSGDTVTLIGSVNVADSISVDKDLSIVVAQGCAMRSTVGEGRSIFVIESGCRDFSIVAEHASRIVFNSHDAGGLAAVLPASLPARVTVRGVNVHDVALADSTALIDVGARPTELFLENCDVFNLRAPVIMAHAGAQPRIAINDSRLERIKGDVAVDLSASPASTLLVRDSVVIGSLGCSLIRMESPNLLLCGNSYLSALGANPVVVDDSGALSESLDSTSFPDMPNRFIA